MITKVKADRRCSDCKKKANSCSTWEEKTEKTVSGWDKNRFAMSCQEFKTTKKINKNCAKCKNLLRTENDFSICSKHLVEVFDWDYCGDWEEDNVVPEPYKED